MTLREWFRSHRLLRYTLLFMAAPPMALGVEPGDVDGDGRLSIRDVIQQRRGLEAVEGSLDAFRQHPCYINSAAFSSESATLFEQSRFSAWIYIESLRRSVRGSYAHWDNFWSGTETHEPLAPSRDLRIDVLSVVAEGGENDRAQLILDLSWGRFPFQTADFPKIGAFSLILDSPEGILRPPFFFHEQDPYGAWDARSWRRVEFVTGERGNVHDFGDVPVGISPATFLITGGRMVVTYGIGWDVLGSPGQPLVMASPLKAGQYRIIVETRLPKGTPPGRYPVKLHPASEVLFGCAGNARNWYRAWLPNRSRSKEAVKLGTRRHRFGTSSVSSATRPLCGSCTR